MDRLKRFIARVFTISKNPTPKKECPFSLESVGGLFLHSTTYREQYFRYGGSLDHVVDVFKEMINSGWADTRPELLFEIPLGLFRCIQEKVTFYEKSRYGRLCKVMHISLSKLGKKSPIDRGLQFLMEKDFRTLAPYLKKQILELTRQHVQAEEKKIKEKLMQATQHEEWQADTLLTIAGLVFRSIHGLLGYIDPQMIDRVFLELSEKREAKFENWVFSQVQSHLPSLLEEKKRAWGYEKK